MDCDQNEYRSQDGKCCKRCPADHHQTEVKACLAHEDRQCACIHGFYCQDPHSCEHCDQVTPCPLGQGVKVNVFALSAFFSDPTDPVAPVSSGLPVVHLIPTELPVISPLIDVHCQESSDPRSHITAACNCCVRDLHATHPEPTSLLSVSQFEALPTLSQFEALPTLSQYEALPTSRRPGMLMDRMYSEPQEDEWGGT
ncbi:unnamed protein product [Merluccius merluccius]